MQAPSRLPRCQILEREERSAIREPHELREFISDALEESASDRPSQDRQAEKKLGHQAPKDPLPIHL